MPCSLFPRTQIKNPSNCTGTSRVEKQVKEKKNPEEWLKTDMVQEEMKRRDMLTRRLENSFK